MFCTIFQDSLRNREAQMYDKFNKLDLLLLLTSLKITEDFIRGQSNPAAIRVDAVFARFCHTQVKEVLT